MEQENKPSMLKGTLIYGAIVGLVSVIVSLILYFVDLSLEKWTGWLSLGIMVVMIVVTLIMYKNEYGKGFIKYGQVVLVGFLISIFAGILSVVQTFAVFKIDESYLQDTKYFAIEEINKRIDKMDLRYQERLSDDDYDVFSERMEEGREAAIEKVKERSAFAFAFPGFFNFVFMGVIISLLAGIVIRKNPPEGPEISA